MNFSAAAKLKQFWRAHRAAVLIFSIALATRLIVSAALFFRYGAELITFGNSDSFGYLSIGKSLAVGDGFKMEGVTSAMRTPLYPLFLSIFYFFNLPLWLIVVWQNIFFSLSAVLVYRLGELLFSKKTGQIASALFIAEPYLLLMTSTAVTEILFIFLLLVSVYNFSFFYLGAESKKRLALSGLFLGLATLTRPVTLYLPILILILFLVRQVFLDKRLAKALPSFLIFSGIFLATLFPWSLRQYLVFGSFKLTNLDSFLLYVRVLPLAEAEELGVDYQTAVKSLVAKLPEKIANFEAQKMTHTFEYDAYLSQEAYRKLRTHLPTVLRYYFLSGLSGFFGTGYDSLLEQFGVARSNQRANFTFLLHHKDYRGFINSLFQFDAHQLALLGGGLLWLVFYALIAIGAHRSFRDRKNFSAVLLMLILTAYFIFFALGPSVFVRYRVLSYPFLFLLLAFSLDTIYGRYRHLFRRNSLEAGPAGGQRKLAE